MQTICQSKFLNIFAESSTHFQSICESSEFAVSSVNLLSVRSFLSQIGNTYICCHFSKFAVSLVYLPSIDKQFAVIQMNLLLIRYSHPIYAFCRQFSTFAVNLVKYTLILVKFDVSSVNCCYLNTFTLSVNPFSVNSEKYMYTFKLIQANVN